MKFGVSIPNHWGVEDPQQMLAVGPMAEELGYASVWVQDHLFNVGTLKERLDDKPYYHPLPILSYLAATTRKVTLGTSVLVLPTHHPVNLAKYLATLDQISGGRVTLGAGVGGEGEEFNLLGIPVRKRGALTDESIAIMKELWSKPYSSYQGGSLNFTEVRFSPKPVQKPHIPVWVGGSSAAARRRAAKVGDGWHPNGLTPEEFSKGRQEVEELAAQEGRDAKSIVMSVRVSVQFQAPAAGGSGSGRAVPGYDPDGMTAAMAAYQEAGVQHMVLGLNTRDVSAITRVMESVAGDVMPRLG